MGYKDMLRLTYVIKFVADMDRSVAYHRDTLGLPLKFQSPEWSEFITGGTTLALHAASPQNPPGKIQIGYSVPDLQAFYEQMSAQGMQFTQRPTLEEGSKLARFIDETGSECSLSEG